MNGSCPEDLSQGMTWQRQKCLQVLIVASWHTQAFLCHLLGNSHRILCTC